MLQVRSCVPLQAVRCVSNACMSLAQFDAYTKALQVIRAGLTKLLVPLYMRGALTPTVRERVVTVHGMWAYIGGVNNFL